MGLRVERAKQLPRGIHHPWAHVSYDADGHTHIYATGGVDTVEECAEGLADAVLICSDSRHDGHGIKHDTSEGEKAYKSAIDQMLTRDYWSEYIDLQRKIEHFEIWGGPVPAVVLQPSVDDVMQWQLAVTHPETGLPHFYDIGDALKAPPPNLDKFVKGQLGHYRRRGATARER